MHRSKVLTGTVILLTAGLITRILGFIFRIYLSDLMGSEGMGLYQLVTPVYFLVFSVCASGTQLALSRLVAARSASKRHRDSGAVLCAGLVPALFLCLVLCALLMVFSDWTAKNLLFEPRLASPLRILSLALPFSVASACLKSYFFALRKMTVPAADQLIEQLARMGAVYLLDPVLSASGSLTDLCRLAAFGTAAGDFVSCLYCVSAYARQPDARTHFGVSAVLKEMPKLLLISLPLSANRVVSQLLSSFESIMLPATLQRSGLLAGEALALYGEFSGMAMPVLFFPSVVTSALSMNLLPVVAGAEATHNAKLIQSAIRRPVHYTLLIGFLFTAVLCTCGRPLGLLLYHNERAGEFIVRLSVLCPFFYIQSTLGGLMNGLGLHRHSFLHSISCDLLRVVILLTFVPRFGFAAFYLGMVVSQILCTFLNVRKLYGTGGLSFHPVREVLPALSCCALSVLLVGYLPFPALSLPLEFLAKGLVCALLYSAFLLYAEPDARALLRKKRS